MILQLILIGYVGILLYVLFDILEFNKRTKSITYFKDTLKFYFTVDNILKISIAVIFVSAIIFISMQVGGIKIIQMLSVGTIDGDTPAELYFFALVLGILNQLFWDKTINLLNRNPKQIDVDNKQ